MSVKQRFIVRATPTLGAVSIWWAKAVEDILFPMNYVKGVTYMRDVRGGEIAECRNKLVAQILTFDREDREVAGILWIDDDVIVGRGCLMQLMSNHTDIASGVYFTKAPPPFAEPLIFPHKGGGTDPFVPAPSDGKRAYPVWGHGMGLCLIRPDVYRRMDKELNLPRDKNGNPEWYRTTGRAEDVKVTDGVIHTGGTEDLYFLDAAAKLGYRPVIDCSKHAFGWHYDLKAQTGYPAPQWAQYEKNQPVTWATPDGPVTWE